MVRYALASVFLLASIGCKGDDAELKQLVGAYNSKLEELDKAASTPILLSQDHDAKKLRDQDTFSREAAELLKRIETEHPDYSKHYRFGKFAKTYFAGYDANDKAMQSPEFRYLEPLD